MCPGGSDLVLTFLFTESGQAVPALLLPCPAYLDLVVLGHSDSNGSSQTFNSR